MVYTPNIVIGRRNVRAGFTLVETVSAMVLVSLVGSVSGGLIYRAAEAYSQAGVGAQLHAEVTSALDPIDRALRSIPGQADGGGPDIVQATPSSISWNGASGEASLSIVAGQLRFSAEGETATPILADVSALVVQCYDESNVALGTTLSGAAVDPIRRVEVTITAQRSGQTEMLRTRVFLRAQMQGSSG